MQFALVKTGSNHGGSFIIILKKGNMLRVSITKIHVENLKRNRVIGHSVASSSLVPKYKNILKLCFLIQSLEHEVNCQLIQDNIYKSL